MIKKELLSLVLGVELEPKRNEVNPIPIGKECGHNVVFYWEKGETNFHNGAKAVCVDTLGRLCKEWCLKQRYYLQSHIQSSGGDCKCTGIDTVRDFRENSELEAILKATEWVANEKGLL